MTHEIQIQPYTDNFIPVIPVDYTNHTPEHPFCWGRDCPCHSDQEAIAHVQHEYEQGLLTAEEAILTIEGKLLGGRS